METHGDEGAMNIVSRLGTTVFPPLSWGLLSVVWLGSTQLESCFGDKLVRNPRYTPPSGSVITFEFDC